MVENNARLNRMGNVIGRRVDFTKNLPLAWGIEVEIPIDEMEKKRLYRKHRIDVPNRINTFRYLDLAPQESLYPTLRNIGRDEEWEYTNLDNLVGGGRGSKRADMERRKTIENLFFLVFGENDIEKQHFNKLLEKGRGNTILAVEGHSWDTPWEIGEHRSRDPKHYQDRKFQKEGNDVAVWRILREYNDPNIYSAIIFIACYCGRRKIKALDVPLAYPVGEVNGDYSLAGLLPTVVIGPQLDLRPNWR